MIEYIQNQIIYFVTGWIIFMLLGLWIKLQTDKFIQVRDVIFAVLFGPFYFVAYVFELDAYVIDLRKKEER